MSMPTGDNPDLGRVLCIGSLALNDTVYADGRTSMASAGGNALYSAVGARLWSDNVALAAVIGTDWPNRHTAALTEHGVDTTHVQPRDGETLRAWTLYEADGGRRYISRNREVMALLPDPFRTAPYTHEEIEAFGHAARTVHAECSPQPRPAPPQADVFHVAPMAMKRMSEWLEAAPEGTRVVLDIPPFPDGTSLEEKAVRALLSKTDAFWPSEVEARTLMADFEPETFCRKVAELGPRIAGVKLGCDGLVFFDRAEGSFHRVPAYACDVVDLTGAGDAFCGGFCAAWAQGCTPLEAALRGTISASFVIEGFGGLHALGIDADRSRSRVDALRRNLDAFADEELSS